MAWYNSLKDLGGDISSGAKAVGHTVGEVASNPIVDAGLGLVSGGVLTPALVAAAGGLLKPGGNIGNAVKSGVTGAAAGEAGNLSSSALSGLLGKLGIGTAAGAAAGAAGNSSGLSSLLQEAEGAFGAGNGNSSLGSLAKMGLLGGAVASEAADRQRQQGLQDQAVGDVNQGIQAATQAYNDNAGLRTEGRNVAMNASAPNLSSMFANGNPYSRGLAVPVSPSLASQQ